MAEIPFLQQFLQLSQQVKGDDENQYYFKHKTSLLNNGLPAQKNSGTPK